MPRKITSCVSKLKKKGYGESSAYGICSKSTGWVRKAGGGWRNKKTGKIYKGK